MNLRAKETAQSTVRVLNDLVGEATDRIEDVLPKVEALPKKIESVLPSFPGRKKQSHTKRNLSATFAALCVAIVVMFAVKRKSASKPAASNYRPVTSPARNGTSTIADLDRDREPAASSN